KVAAAAAASGPAVVAGRGTLADDLVAKAPPDATVFIFARPAQGSRMPVAIVRKRVRDLPLDFTLDDSSSMVSDVKLSKMQTVVVGARVSARGDVMPQPGDMQGWSAPVPVGTRGIHLEISEVLK
ncbi:MAG: c-type cytochrome biogenesis protein CcmI/CycH, partial [Caldimonas sp.]